MRLIVVKATWDEEAHYWVAESPDVPGLATGAATLEELHAKLPTVIEDLLDAQDEEPEVQTFEEAETFEVPIHLVASADSRITLRRARRE